MSCYHPLKGLKLGKDANGKEIIKIVPYDSIDAFRSDGRPYEFYTLPCGHCIGCRQDQAREWSNRLLLESQYHDSAYFLTLTYDELHAPRCYRTDIKTGEAVEGTTLDKRDIQLFFKRLRREFPDSCIRYYLAGEYGPKTLRAHYHAIIFGLPDSDLKFVPFGKSETGNPYFVCDRIRDIWSNGNISIEPANYYTFKYCSAYVTSKVGRYPNDFWIAQGLVPPFSTMSRKPGIGCQYLIDHPDCVENDRIVISTPDGAVEFPPPRYFKKQFKELCPEEYQVLADRHQKAAEDKKEAELSKTDLSYSEYLKVKEQNHYAKLRIRDKL